MDFRGRVAIVTGAGGGLGKEYALLFSSAGASVVVNDVGVGVRDNVASTRPADAVVDLIRARGGTAVANYDSVENGAAIVDTALNAFGKVDILINNAGILRDKSFGRMSEEEWDLVQKVHLKGSFSVTRAAWEHMRKQNYGRIIMTASTAGIYGNFGQASYAAAKMALIGLSNTLAIEGAKYGIHCNVIVPMAASRLTQDVLPPDIFDKLKPEAVAPVVAWLCHEDCQENGGVFEAAGGLVSRYRWERSRGVVLDPITLPKVREEWDRVCDFSNPTYPTTNPELMSYLMTDLTAARDNQDSSAQRRSATSVFKYTPKDVILYALSVGASVEDLDNLKYVYEGHTDFCVLPTFAILPAQHCLGASGGSFLSAVEGLNLDLSKLLHGEQYLKLYRPLETEDELTSSYREVARLDKGSGCLLVLNVDTKNRDGDLVATNQFCLFLVGEGGFGGPRSSDEVVPAATMPSRAPDVVLQFETGLDQAALYRLNGDVNPLHIDPDMAALMGFKAPIMHGLCSLGIVVRQLIHYFNVPAKSFQTVKVRFNAPVVPGQILETNVWVEKGKLYFTTAVLGGDKTALTGGALEVHSDFANSLLGKITPNESANVSSKEVEAVFESIQTVLKDASFETKSRPVILWVLQRKDDSSDIWTVDLQPPSVRTFQGKPSGKPDVTVKMSVDDFLSVANDRLSLRGAMFQRRIAFEGNLALLDAVRDVMSAYKRSRKRLARL